MIWGVREKGEGSVFTTWGWGVKEGTKGEGERGLEEKGGGGREREGGGGGGEVCSGVYLRVRN